MKKQVALFLLCCYTLVLLRPVVPCVTDFLAHSFWSTDHIATVHYENGKYHLHVEIKEAAGATENAPASSAPKLGCETAVVHLLPNALVLPEPNVNSIQFSDTRVLLIAHPFLAVSSPPPWPVS